MRVVIATGGFDPIHSGHIAYLNAASELGDILLVGLNSNEWLVRKKGRYFMSYEERFSIINNLYMVHSVLRLRDDDNTASDAIIQGQLLYPGATIVFVNGGDRTVENIPEMEIFKYNPSVEFVFNVGGDQKQNSSSWLLEEWKAPRTFRPWGEYRVLHNYGAHTKLKELTVHPGQRLSMQRHEHRSEFWFVAEGQATVYTVSADQSESIIVINKHDHIRIPCGEWHQLANNSSDTLLRMIEIQFGTDCIEEDIERLHYN